MVGEETLIQEFAVEGKSHVEKIEAALLEIEKGQEDPSLINVLFRSAHSIKGTAGFFGLHKIVALSHSMENLLGKIRNNEMIIDSAIIDVLLKANDKLRVMFEIITDSENTDITFYIQKLAQFASPNTLVSSHKQDINNKHSVKESGSGLSQKKIMDSDTSEKYKTEIMTLVKRGHKLYKLVLKIGRRKTDREFAQASISKKITSVGNMISCYTDNTDNGVFADNTKENYVVFIFSTVLEKKLAMMNLDVQDVDLIQLDETMIDAEILKIVHDDEARQEPQGEDTSTSTGAEKVEQSDTSHKRNDREEDSIRVNVGLLNNLVNLSGEMVLARNRLVRILANHGDEIPGIGSVLQDIDYMTTELQEKIMRTRMQTLANLFNVMPRIVRELAKDMGKSINLSIEGKAVEMDKSMIEGLSDPLTHLLRNALDHGTETSVIRKAAGKPPIAEVLIKAYHEGGRVFIDIIDDGAGINLEKVKIKALQRGMISKEQLDYISEHELLNMIFMPGFSTAEAVNAISGRGVGLDVAKANIEKLGGRVEVYTVFGKGTTFRLILPLTMAIIPSIIIAVAGQHFALAQIHVQEILRIVPGQFEKIEHIQGHQILRLRDKLVPIVHLADILGLPIEHKSSIVRVLILKNNAKVFGLIVDEIHDQEDILVKPIPRYLKGTKGYSGLTILGDGKVAMVLDTERIGTAAKVILADEHIQGLAIENLLVGDIREPQKLLLFKCFGTETFALPLTMIARVEKLDARNIEVVGQQEYINFRGNSLRLIRLADYLPISQVKTTGHQSYVIIPKMVKHTMGIIIEKIQDTVLAKLEIDKQELNVRGLFGSAILNDRIILLLNLFGVFDMVIPEAMDVSSRQKIKQQDINLLLVEDTPFLANIEKQYLEWAGYHVITVTNGREALDVLRQRKIDVVLSDLDMPVMDGYTLVKIIRADAQLASLPVIALTSSVVSALQETIITEDSFDTYAYKFDRIDLLEKVITARFQRGGGTQ